MGTDNNTGAGRRRDWLSVGDEYTGPAYRPAIEEAIERLTWCTVAADGQISGPMSPVMARFRTSGNDRFQTAVVAGPGEAGPRV